jgi:hypothetical protein
MSLNQPLLLSSALVHQVLLSPTTYPYKQMTATKRVITAFLIGKSPGVTHYAEIEGAIECAADKRSA